jgi:hypothetical protein
MPSIAQRSGVDGTSFDRVASALTILTFAPAARRVDENPRFAYTPPLRMNV